MPSRRRLRQIAICSWAAAVLSLASIVSLLMWGQPISAVISLRQVSLTPPLDPVQMHAHSPGEPFLWIASGLFGGSLSIALLSTPWVLFGFDRKTEESASLPSGVLAQARELYARRKRGLIGSTEFKQRLAEIVQAL